MVKRGSIKIDILPLAKKDLAEIYEFIAKESVKYAKIERQLIIKAIILFPIPVHPLITDQLKPDKWFLGIT